MTVETIVSMLRAAAKVHIDPEHPHYDRMLEAIDTLPRIDALKAERDAAYKNGVLAEARVWHDFILDGWSLVSGEHVSDVWARVGRGKKFSADDAGSFVILLLGDCHRLRTERDALEAEVVVLRGALEAVEWVENAEEFTDESKWCPRCKMFERHGHDEDCQLDTALASPSPAAEAVRGVLEATIRAEKAHIEYMELLGTSTKLPNVQIEKVSKEMDVADKELEKAIAAYLALRDGRADGGWNDSETKVQVS